VNEKHHLNGLVAIYEFKFSPITRRQSDAVQGQRPANGPLADERNLAEAKTETEANRTGICTAHSLLALLYKGKTWIVGIGICFLLIMFCVQDAIDKHDKLILPAVSIAGMRITYKPRFILVDENTRKHTGLGS